MIDLEALVSLRAVESHGSVVAAAAALGYTPSAVSQQVKRLERQVGLPLLERVGRGVILSGAGRRLSEDGADLLAHLEQVESVLHEADDRVSGHLRMAAFATAIRGIVAPALGRLQSEQPDLRVSLHEREPWDAVDAVAAGRDDLGVVHSWGDVPLTVPGHLQATVLAHDVADVIVRSDHRLAGRRSISPRDLRDVRWIATPEGTICRQWLNRMYAGTGSFPVIAHVSSEFETHVSLVRAGLGIALVPRTGRAPLPNDVAAVTVRDPVPEREISVQHRRSMAASPAVRAVVEALRAEGAAATASA